MFRNALCALGALVFGSCLLVSPAKAGPQDELTKFTFTNPVEVPGAVLQPGSYWFKVSDQQNDQQLNVIQIYTEDFSRLVADVPAISEQHEAEGYGTAVPVPAMNDIELKVAEGQGKQPQTLMGWFYPYGFSGHELVYSANERARLSETKTQTVLLPVNSSDNEATYSGD